MCRLPLNLILAKNDLPKIAPFDKVQIFKFSKKVYHVGIRLLQVVKPGKVDKEKEDMQVDSDLPDQVPSSPNNVKKGLCSY